jgi:hypothetical protein
MVTALPAIISYTLFLWRERTNILEWRLDVVYSCFSIFIAVLVLRRFTLIVGLLATDWKSSVREVEGDSTTASNPK